MITAVVALGNFALDVAEGPFDDRRTVTAGVPIEAGEFIGPFGGKTARNLLLSFA